MKKILPVALLSALFAGCGQTPPPAPSAPAQAPAPANPVAPATSATPAAPSAKPQVVEPQASTVFVNEKACVAAGYGQAQCARAASTARAMASMDAPTYSSRQECTKLFSTCDMRPKSRPMMVAFSIGNEPKTQGAAPAASAAAPLWHEPVYLDAAGKQVFLKRMPDGSTAAVQVSAPRP